jgi:hypothetical protein
VLPVVTQTCPRSEQSVPRLPVVAPHVVSAVGLTQTPPLRTSGVAQVAAHVEFEHTRP